MGLPPTHRVLGGLLLALALASGCARIPENRYGVARLRLEGVDDLDPRAVASCLATRERDRFQLVIGQTWNPTCGVPPFDANRLRVPMWRWPWTEWPLYDRALFERDLERIERWYRARGYYDARVVETSFRPTQAGVDDRVRPRTGDVAPECGEGKRGCRLDITVRIEEGEPVLVRSVDVVGIDALPPRLQRRIRNAVALPPGARFDEALYDTTKAAIARHLRDESYACAQVEGEARVDPRNKSAAIEFRVDPGPEAVLGDIRVEGQEHLPVPPILGASLLRRGDPYLESELEDAQRAIYALGAFSSVQVDPQIDEQSCPTQVVDVVIRVTPGREQRWGFGAGIQSGTVQGLFEQIDIRQWDIHLLALYEHRNLFGGMRRLRIEERPRLIFPANFPQIRGRAADGTTRGPQLGNLLTVEFRQPAFPEPRTTLVVMTRWDLGPEPFGARFDRHDLDGRIALERSFLGGRVFGSLGIHGNLFRVITDRDPPFDGGTRDYDLLFFEQFASLDLRDNPQRPRRGAFFGMGLHEAGFILPGSWDYIRVTPEGRGYVPLPLGIVLATRFAVGAMFISDAQPNLTELSRRLGPERFRLRGGGPSSNRGFIAGDLGDGIEGGLRRWEGSLELRVPLSDDFGLAFFGDVGDVSQEPIFRFDFINLAVGFGLRYQTIVGPLRFDVGYRVPNAQVVGGPDPRPRFEVDFGFVRFAGAVHLTIGESF